MWSEERLSTRASRASCVAKAPCCLAYPTPSTDVGASPGWQNSVCHGREPHSELTAFSLGCLSLDGL